MKVSVILQEREAERFDEYCKKLGHKKSTLIARLIREHLDKEEFEIQRFLPLEKNEAK